jgi:hypothetical protein
MGVTMFKLFLIFLLLLTASAAQEISIQETCIFNGTGYHESSYIINGFLNQTVIKEMYFLEYNNNTSFIYLKVDT